MSKLTFSVLQLPAAADRVDELLDDFVVGVVEAEQLGGGGGVLLLGERTSVSGGCMLGECARCKLEVVQ